MREGTLISGVRRFPQDYSQGKEVEERMSDGFYL